jgi:hypothetical protein
MGNDSVGNGIHFQEEETDSLLIKKKANNNTKHMAEQEYEGM